MRRVRTLSRTMPDLRAAVLAELKRRGLSHYDLVEMLKGKRPDGGDVPDSNVYQFLSGRRKSVNLADLGLIFDALGLGVTAADAGRKREGGK